MGNILNPSENNSFIKLANSKKYLFVDKTDFIEHINERINEDNCFLAITRPRRFGKTVTAHMLSAYYSKAYTGHDIFDKLKIEITAFKSSVNAKYKEHLEALNSIPDAVPMDPERMAAVVLTEFDKAPEASSFVKEEKPVVSEPVVEEVQEIEGFKIEAIEEEEAEEY